MRRGNLKIGEGIEECYMKGMVILSYICVQSFQKGIKEYAVSIYVDERSRYKETERYGHLPCNWFSLSYLNFTRWKCLTHLRDEKKDKIKEHINLFFLYLRWTRSLCPRPEGGSIVTPMLPPFTWFRDRQVKSNCLVAPDIVRLPHIDQPAKVYGRSLGGHLPTAEAWIPSRGTVATAPRKLEGNRKTSN